MVEKKIVAGSIKPISIETPKKHALEVSNRILRALSNRKGFDSLLEEIDSEIYNEISNEIIGILVDYEKERIESRWSNAFKRAGI